MATPTTFPASPVSVYKNWLNQTAGLILLVFLTINSVACSQASQSNSGSKKRVQMYVGEIKELSLSGRGDGSSELIATSDNQEIVEVSRQQLTPAVDTLKRDNTGPTVFQIKGVTAGTANVVFYKKQLNQTGNGQVIRTYVVQVMAK